MKARGLLLLILAISWATTAWSAQQNAKPFTLEDCIQQALHYNLDVQIQRYGPLAARYNLSLAYAGYDPVFEFSGQTSFRRESGGLDEDQRVIPRFEEEGYSFDTSLGGALPWGMTYSLAGNARNSEGERGDTIGTNVLITPFESTDGAMLVTLRQPFLKNFWIDDRRFGIASSKNLLEQSELDYRFIIMNIVTGVENAYYDLIQARENMKVQEMALALAEQTLADNRKKVEVGALAPLDEKQAEAQVAAFQAEMLSAQAAVSLAANALKNLLTDAYGDWHDMVIEPADKLQAPVYSFDLQDSWSKGMSQRPDLLKARLELERQGIELRYRKNQLYPQLDAFGTYGLSGGRSGLEFNETFAEIGEGGQPFWSAGAVISFPLANRGARASYRIAKVGIEQSVLALKQLEQSVMVQIDDAVKLAEVSYRRVGATRLTRKYAQAALDAEQRKLENGKSTSFIVLQLQRDLTSARFEEIRALVEYRKSLVQLVFSEGSTLQRHRINLEMQ